MSTLRTAIVVLATALAIAGVTAEPATGRAPLECDGRLYVTTGRPGRMTLNRVDQVTGALTRVGDGGLVANGLGHNPADDFLYGIGTDAPHHVVRVSADGEETDLGAPTPMPRSWERTFAGTFLPNGRYLVLGDGAPAQTPRGTVPATWAEIDVTRDPLRVVRTFSHPSVGNNDLEDVAVNPVDGRLYAHSIIRQRIVRIDLRSGAATPVGPRFDAPVNAGSAFFDSFGRLWLYGSSRVAGRQDTLFRIDDVGRSRPIVVARGPEVIHSDGASCPFTIGLEKRVHPVIACEGTSVTYRYTVTNQAVRVDGSGREAGEAVTADFLDQLPADGRTFVAGTLVNPFGGEANAYGGTGRLRIDELRIPHDSTATIEVDVALPPSLGRGTVTNQAHLLDLSGNRGADLRSEYPGTPQSPDPTPLAVHACADLGVTKSADPGTVGPGDRVTYAIRVTNHGPSDARGVSSVADPLPDGLTFVAATAGGRLEDGVVRWPAMDLAAGAHRELVVTATVDAGAEGRVENTAVVQHPGDPVPDNDRGTAVVDVEQPDLVVQKDDGRRLVAPGDEVTYTVVVRNTGTGQAGDVVVTDRLPDGLHLVSGSASARAVGGAVTWPAFDLAAGVSRRLQVTVRVARDAAPGSVVRNVASAPWPDDPTPANNTDDDRDRIRQEPAEPPTPDPSPPPAPVDDSPTRWLPRTGLAAASWAAIGAGLVALGLAGVRFSRRA